MGRDLHLQRVVNIRDLGGLPVDGGRVSPGRIYRSGSLHEMTASDRSELERRKIVTVIDLRSPWERRHHPYDWPFGRVVSAPMADDDLVAAVNERFRSGSIDTRELEDWWRLVGVLDAPMDHAASIRRVFEALLDPALDGDGAVLFHCRGGKDRTGVVAALLLEALGVARAQITADFLLSNEAMNGTAVSKDFEDLAAAPWALALPPAALTSLTGVRREWLDELFARIEAGSGSVPGYLSDVLGLGGSDIAALRARYVEPTL